MRLLLLFSLATSSLVAQYASVRGKVTDESGAVIPGAKIVLRGASNFSRQALAASDGTYVFAGLPAGDYSLMASAPDLALPAPLKFRLDSGVRTMDLQLRVVTANQQVTVQDNAGPNVSADPSNNAGALVMRGNDLQSLADNEEDLAADLQALAGPSAGPNGGSIFIDGFSGGQLPSKESIREIRINQNPFSPEYDKLGFGRIEIFTKPGTDKFKGTAYFNYADDFWNSRNPFAARKAPFLLKEYGGNLSGPISRKASFFFDVRRDSIDNGAIINGTTLDPATLAIVSPYTDVFRLPQRRVMVSPRLDYQLSTNNTLTARYSFARSAIDGTGVGSFNLISRGTDIENRAHTLQLTETAVIGANVVNETRFQFIRNDLTNSALTTGPAIQVLGSFNGGGSPVGQFSEGENSYELQNYTSVVKRGHTWRFGVRMRGDSLDNYSPSNFNGTFTFGGGLAPVLDANNRPVVDAAGQPVLAEVQSIERYRRTLLFSRQGLPPAQIRALGGGGTQYSVNAGTAAVSASQVDAGLFAGDDWRMRSNMTLSVGLRYEVQTNIDDWRGFAPRVGFAWAPGPASGKGRSKTVLRAGFGMFYDRFGLSNTVTAMRYNGVLQRQYVVANPDFFPAAPLPAGLSAAASVIQQVSADLRAPYIMQSAVGVERQLPANTTVSVTYANAHGLHILRSRDINPAGAPIFQMESAGLYNQNQTIVSVNSRVNKNTSLFGSYVLNRAMSNTDGVGTFPANPYSFEGEYSNAATDLRQRGTFGGAITTKWDFRLNPLFVAESGPPFDITAGRDLYGTTLFNGRPGIAADPNKPGVIRTAYGLLDPNPTPGGKILPRNYGRGPGSIMLNLRISKVFAFGSGEGHEGPAGLPGSGGDRRRDTSGVFGPAGGSQQSQVSHRFNLTISMSIRNVLNHTNPGAIIGNITSPQFGQANQAAGMPAPGGIAFSEAANNRRLELQTRFTF